MQNEIKSILQDVRSSYRFLFNYQKRVLDLISFIGGNFGQRYAGGYIKFSGPTPRNGKGNLTNWAWDWLPMYFYEFNFEKFKVKQDNLVFSVFLINDTGYFTAAETSKISKTKVSAFETVEKSTTKLIFVIGKNLWEDWGNNWQTNDFINKESGIRIKDDGSIMIFKSYLLENFSTEDLATEQLKDFERYALKNNIPFKILEKKF